MLGLPWKSAPSGPRNPVPFNKGFSPTFFVRKSNFFDFRLSQRPAVDDLPHRA
jgi:hypothetical protein